MEAIINLDNIRIGDVIGNEVVVPKTIDMMLY